LYKYQNWVIASPDQEEVNKLATSLGVDPLVATLLLNRHIDQPEAARQFLTEEWNGEFPWLAGCDEAANLLQKAREQGLPVVIYGDYDVDGISSTAIMYECLKYLGYQVSYRLPNRFTDGYGLTSEAVTDIAAAGGGLLLTVDCGISAVNEVRLAHELGLSVIITDHHQLGNELPSADTIINPRLNHQGDGHELCGAGVAFCLAMTLLNKEGEGSYSRRWLDLLALATVADIVPLTGYNRLWVREGLQKMRSRIGLQRLLATARVRDGELSAYHIGYILGPRLNAAGRLDDAEPALELLLTEDEERAEELATWLDGLNSQRQQVEEDIFRQAQQSIEAYGSQVPEVLVLAGEGWHQGVVGIVASRVAQRYQRPAVLVAWGDENGKGSARSVAGFDILEALRQSAACLEHFGGHRGAAGVELSRENFTAFCQRINQVAADCYFEPTAAATLYLDSELPTSSLKLDLGEWGHRLRPYGEGNPAPVLKTTASFERVTRMGKSGEHFKGWLSGVSGAEVICFREGELAEEISYGCDYDLAFTPEINEFNGRRTLSLRLLDIRPGEDKPRGVTSRFTHPAWEETDQPHLVVCPDQRTLDLLWPYYREIYRDRAVALCGRALHSNRALEMLNRGESRLFLTTPVYFPYHIKKFGSPQGWAVWLPINSDVYPDAFLELLKEHGMNPQSLGLLAAEDANSALQHELVYSRQPTIIPADIRVDEMQVRSRSEKLARRQQWINNGGTLFTSGEVLDTAAVAVSKLVMADPPVSRGEWQLLQMNFNPQEQAAGFLETAVTATGDYFYNRYPDATLVKEILKYLAAHVSAQQIYNRDRLQHEIGQTLGRPVGWQLLAGALTVLAQTGVITVRTLNEQVTINRLSNGGEVRLADSLYYLESKWELREWLAWESKLPQLAGAGGVKDWNQMN